MKPPVKMNLQVKEHSDALEPMGDLNFMENSYQEMSEAASVDATLSNASAYEQLRREGELHMQRGHILEDLKKNVSRLEDLHGRLEYMMKEIHTVLRR